LPVFEFVPKNTNCRILAVCAGRQKGQPKRSIGQGQLLRNFGLSGDCDTGPDSEQIILVSQGDWTELKNQNPSLIYGELGENLVVSLNLAPLPIGTRLRSGDALMELTRAEPPLYAARVILNGIVTEGDPIVVE
jgi:MOSC domain-containing protein YiiM